MADSGQPVTMDTIVSLCRRRGFVFPSSEIYGGLGSTYDYGHYGVLTKNNIRSLWFRAMVQERDDIVALDSAIILNPRVWEASGHVAGFTDPLVDCRTCKLRFRADQLELAQLRPQAEQAARRDARLRPHRAAAVQPHVRDACGGAPGRELGRVPPSGDRPGHLHQLQERRPARATQAAVRHRTGRQVVPERDHPGQLPLPRPRVRADGDGVLRPACGRHQVARVLARAEGRLAPQPRPPRREPSRARARRERALALLERDERHRVPLPDRLAGARGSREPRRVRPHPAHAALGHEARVDRSRRQSLHAIRDRAGGQHRADLRRASLRRVSRGGRRRPRARGAPAAPAGGARKGGDPAAHPARRGDGDAGSHALRGVAPPPHRRARRGRPDRQALPAPGRNRYAVGVHRRRTDARGRDRDRAGPGLACAGEAADRRSARVAGRRAAAGLVLAGSRADGRRLRPRRRDEDRHGHSVDDGTTTRRSRRPGPSPPRSRARAPISQPSSP